MISAALLASPALSCGGPSEDSIKKEFAAYVAGANACVVDSECQVAFPGCPLGCEVAVRADRVDDVTKKAASLIQQYESDSHEVCAYSCAESKALCMQGRCVLDIDTATPARGGANPTEDGGINDAAPDAGGPPHT